MVELFWIWNISFCNNILNIAAKAEHGCWMRMVVGCEEMVVHSTATLNTARVAQCVDSIINPLLLILFFLLLFSLNLCSTSSAFFFYFCFIYLIFLFMLMCRGGMVCNFNFSHFLLRTA